MGGLHGNGDRFPARSNSIKHAQCFSAHQFLPQIERRCFRWSRLASPDARSGVSECGKSEGRLVMWQRLHHGAAKVRWHVLGAQPENAPECDQHFGVRGSVYAF